MRKCKLDAWKCWLQRCLRAQRACKQGVLDYISAGMRKYGGNSWYYGYQMAGVSEAVDRMLDIELLFKAGKLVHIHLPVCYLG